MRTPQESIRRPTMLCMNDPLCSGFCRRCQERACLTLVVAPDGMQQNSRGEALWLLR
jgi:hypothetical protein